MRSLLALAAAAAALAASVPASAAGPIVFSSDRDGDHEIYASRPDGTRVTRLTRNRANDHTPVWSPDGSRIAFVSDRDGDEEIFVMRADGTRVRRLTRNGLAREGHPIADFLPTWAPNGRRLAFVSNRRGGQFDVYTVRRDGSSLRRLTRTRGASEYGPAWSPNGRRIAFGSNRLGEGNLEIFTVRPDGSDVRRITFTGGDFEFPEDDTLPAWSPDGKWLAFESNRDGNGELYVIDANGGSEKRLTDTPHADESEPAWSPDGRRLVFTAHRFDRPFVVESIRLPDGARTRLARGASPDWRWAPRVR